MKGRRDRVSLAWMAAVLLGACALLGSRPADGPVDTAERATLATDPALELTQAPGMGCSVVKELNFEMLPADAEPRAAPSRHTPVCLAVYAPR